MTYARIPWDLMSEQRLVWSQICSSTVRDASLDKDATLDSHMEIRAPILMFFGG